MSLIKNIIEYKDKMYSYAMDILIEIGEIKRCDCGGIFYQIYKYDEKDIYAIATNKLKEKYGEQSDYTAFHKAIKKILTEAGTGNHCPYCHFNEED